jgi:uncharacterized protein (DUF952 family)
LQVPIRVDRAVQRASKFLHEDRRLEGPTTGLDDLVLVSFATTALGGALRWEPSRGGALFPHLYAALPAVLASSTRPLALGADGVPLIPGDVLE